MPEVGGFALVKAGAAMEWIHRPQAPLGEDDVRVRVVGCGLCHTDLGFAYDGVGTRHPLPLILGHEVAGYVEDAAPKFAHLVGKAVIVPAVIPCGRCADCLAGAEMICKKQVFPGNDRHGGFATHLEVPGAGLCVVDEATSDPDAQLGDIPGLTLRHLAVIADAVSTPYQAIQRSGLQQGDLAVVIGLGGVGGYAAQIASAFDAHVVGIDVSAARIANAASLGCELAIDPRAQDTKALRTKLREHAIAVGAPTTRWKIFECSGSGAGQTTAFDILVHGATLMVVGFTMDKLTVRLSNLMAFDARAIGNWGCAPAFYPAIVRMVLDGKIQLVPHVELRPLEQLPAAFEDVHGHRVSRRIVLAPGLPSSQGSA